MRTSHSDRNIVLEIASLKKGNKFTTDSQQDTPYSKMWNYKNAPEVEETHDNLYIIGIRLFLVFSQCQRYRDIQRFGATFSGKGELENSS